MQNLVWRGSSGGVLGLQHYLTMGSGHRTFGALDGSTDGNLGMAGQGLPGVVDLARVLAALCEDERATVPTSAEMALYVVLQPFAVRAGVAVLVCLAAHELLRNALTHAFPTGTGGRVGIHLWRTHQAGPRAYLLIADDGCGFGTEPPATADSGLTLARHFLDTVGAQLVREPGRGTIWRIGLP